MPTLTFGRNQVHFDRTAFRVLDGYAQLHVLQIQNAVVAAVRYYGGREFRGAPEIFVGVAERKTQQRRQEPYRSKRGPCPGHEFYGGAKFSKHQYNTIATK